LQNFDLALEGHGSTILKKHLLQNSELVAVGNRLLLYNDIFGTLFIFRTLTKVYCIDITVLIGPTRTCWTFSSKDRCYSCISASSLQQFPVPPNEPQYPIPVPSEAIYNDAINEQFHVGYVIQEQFVDLFLNGEIAIIVQGNLHIGGSAISGVEICRWRVKGS